MNSCAKLLLVLLAESAFGFGQQAPASTLERVVADAQAAQAGGHYSAAAADYAEAVKMRPDTPELWANLGLMQQETGDLSAAASSFLRANRLNPALYVPNLFLGIDYAHGGRAKEAIPLLMKAEKINPTDPQAPLALGRAYIADGNFSAAARALDRAIALSPKLGPAWFTLGIARLDQVEADARILSEEGKQSSFAGALYAESLVKQARYGEAASLYKTLLDSQPQPPCLRSELGFALLREHDRQNAASAFAAERAAHPECGLALLGQARIAMEEGDAAEAMSILEELWKRDRGFFESHASILAEGLPQDKASAMASVLSAEESAHLPEDLHKTLLAVFDPLSQNPSGASPATEEILADPASASHPTAQSDYSAGEFRQCALRLESSAAPLSADKLRLLAACSFLTGDNERASKAADALRELEPRSLEALYWSIQANERVAFQSLARFQELEPDSARSHVLLGDIYQQLERHEDAQAEYRKALALAPGDPAATLGLASAYLSNGNDDGAMELARSALASSPGDPEMNLILGEALMSQRAYAEAEPYLLKSLHAKPQMLPRIHALIGKAYAETGRTQEAIEQLKLGAASDEDGSVEYLLARLYRKIGDSKNANEALERMKTIKEQRETRGMKRVEDPDLSPLEAVGTQASAP